MSLESGGLDSTQEHEGIVQRSLEKGTEIVKAMQLDIGA